ncbi:MTRF1L release factor glutamine methyltransferase [Narcine bancroftii]|uniref:MTRF1L release factor glutamine methyltransferase n=1 Tax=Narcine bancroftii TaxID=1343680 RepID=UPI0038313A10
MGGAEKWERSGNILDFISEMNFSFYFIESWMGNSDEVETARQQKPGESLDDFFRELEKLKRNWNFRDHSAEQFGNEAMLSRNHSASDWLVDVRQKEEEGGEEGSAHVTGGAELPGRSEFPVRHISGTYTSAGRSEHGPTNEYQKERQGENKIEIHSLGSTALTCPLTPEQKQTIWDLCSKRLQHMPVQYVIEEWDFCDLTLKVKPPVFIPRPETEGLVDLIVSELTKEKAPWQSFNSAFSPFFLEIGCGSGAIILSLLHFFKQSFAVAVDKSPEAVNLTRENAERLCVHHRLQEFQLNVLSDAYEVARVCGAVDVIVSNPPYVFHEDMSELMPEILRYEDHGALHGGVDGMDIIRPILHLASIVLKEHGKIFLEIDPRHPVMIENWLQECPRLQLRYQATHQDLYGKLTDHTSYILIQITIMRYK